MGPGAGDGPTLRCSFCGRPETVVAQLVAGQALPTSYICDDCAHRAVRIMDAAKE